MALNADDVIARLGPDRRPVGSESRDWRTARGTHRLQAATSGIPRLKSTSRRSKSACGAMAAASA